MKVKLLRAFNGDAILLSFIWKEKPVNVLIDGGMPSTYLQKGRKTKEEYGDLYYEIERIKKKGQNIDLLILTHVDNDHIGGILKWFSLDKKAHKIVKKVWFNSGRLIFEYFDQRQIKDNRLYLENFNSLDTSILQGKTFEGYIKKHKIWQRKIIRSKTTLKILGLEFKIIAPSRKKLALLLNKWVYEYPDSVDTAPDNDYDLSLKKHQQKDKFKEDEAVHNGSSIAFILKYKENNMLFLGDAHPSDIVDSLKYFGYSFKKKLKARFVKLSHHGSKSNNSSELFQMIDSKNYVVSTNGEHHAHPNKQMLARLASIHNKCNIYFNYPELVNKIFSKKDKIDFPGFKPLSKKNNEFTI